MEGFSSSPRGLGAPHPAMAVRPTESSSLEEVLKGSRVRSEPEKSLLSLPGVQGQGRKLG